MIKTSAPSLTFSCAPINFSLPLLRLQTPWLHSCLHCPDLFSSGCFIPHRFHPCPSCSSRAHCQQAAPALLTFTNSSLPQHLYICQYGFTYWYYLIFSQFGALLTLASFSHSSQPARTDQGTTQTISAGGYKKERPKEVLRGTDSALRRKKEPEPFLLTGTPSTAALCPLLPCSVLPPPSPPSLVTSVGSSHSMLEPGGLSGNTCKPWRQISRKNILTVPLGIHTAPESCCTSRRSWREAGILSTYVFQTLVPSMSPGSLYGVFGTRCAGRSLNGIFGYWVPVESWSMWILTQRKDKTNMLKHVFVGKKRTSNNKANNHHYQQTPQSSQRMKRKKIKAKKLWSLSSRMVWLFEA